MIKRYGLGANLEALTTNSMKPGLVQIVERKDGDYVRYEDYAAAMESIGAGGVSGRITQKTLEQHREEFEGFCRANGLNAKQDTRTGSGLFNSHVVGWMWKAWKAARGVTE